jgi:hypothetical protein
VAGFEKSIELSKATVVLSRRLPDGPDGVDEKVILITFNFPGGLGHKSGEMVRLMLFFLLFMVVKVLSYQNYGKIRRKGSYLSAFQVLERNGLTSLQMAHEDDSIVYKNSNYNREEEDDEDVRPRGFGKPKVKPEQVRKKTAEDKNLESAIENSSRFTRIRKVREKELDDKIARLEEQDRLLAEDPSVGAVPQIVADRMITRIAAFFGIPVFGGLGIFVAAFFYSKANDLVVPPSIVAYGTQVPFVLGLVGITYGILSASWEDEPGSFLGFKEFQTNVRRVRDGIDNTVKTKSLREEVQREKEKLQRK